jgi:hypothetical protein
MLRSPLCRHCHLPVKAGEFFRIAGYTVWVHPGCAFKTPQVPLGFRLVKLAEVDG